MEIAKIESQTTQYIVVNLGIEQYGIDIKYVDNIVRMQKITRVPKAPRFFRGVINLRGEIVPIMSVRRKFELDEDVITDKTRIIIVKIEDAMVGLIVDEVKEVVEIHSAQVEAVHNIQGKMKSNHILGVGKLEDNIVTLLNLSNIIDEAFATNEIK